MGESVNHDVWHVIDETGRVYRESSDYNAINADYAAFASLAIGQFRNALGTPNLTEKELRFLLRQGMSQYRQNAEEADWTTFLATYMSRSSNVNDVT